MVAVCARVACWAIKRLPLPVPAVDKMLVSPMVIVPVVVAGAFTVSVNEVVFVSPPPVPVTVTV